MRGDAERSDYKTNRNTDKQINIVTVYVSRNFLKLLIKNLLMINSIKMSLLASVLNMVPLKYSYFTYLVNLIKVQVFIKSRFLTMFRVFNL